MADLLGAIEGALGLTKGGEITKLIVESFDNSKREKKINSFEAYINPEEYTLNYNVALDQTSTPGNNTNAKDVVLQVQPLEISLRFYLDGTNAIPDIKTGKKLDIPQKIAEFHNVIGYDGKAHKPRYLRIVWGKAHWLRVNQNHFDCFLKSATFQYKLFGPDGSPLRVIINATFTEVLSETISQALDDRKSPDLTHVRIVKEGDTLPSISYDIYGDFKYYLEVAKANNLKDFRNLQPGQKIFFPPFDKKTKAKNNV